MPIAWQKSHHHSGLLLSVCVSSFSCCYITQQRLVRMNNDMSYAGLLAFLFVCCRAGGCGVMWRYVATHSLGLESFDSIIAVWEGVIL